MKLSTFLSALLATVKVGAALALSEKPTYECPSIHPSVQMVFTVEDVLYMADSRHAMATLSVSHNGHRMQIWRPLTAMHIEATLVTEDTIRGLIEAYTEDDVFNISFTNMIFISTSEGSIIEESAMTYLESLGTSDVLLPLNAKTSQRKSVLSIAHYHSDLGTVLEGPYLASTASDMVRLHSVYRLYPDLHGTFVQGSYQINDGMGTHQPLGVMDTKFGGSEPLLIPVPSRIYSRSDNRSLAGMRVGVKDLFDVKGLQTTGGSKAWATINPIANHTAPAIQRIIDLGGVIVGKQKLAQFASPSDPWLWQDYHPPFNPRGDGWLTCSGSSSGGACSIAAYSWLDYAIGTDTGYSMRLPASVAGVYGQRPSQGMMTLDGAIPVSHASDTTGVFCRDPKKWVHFLKAWYTPSLHQKGAIPGLPAYHAPRNMARIKRLVYLTDYLPLANPDAQIIMEQFFRNLGNVFDISIEIMNLTALISQSSEPAVRAIFTGNETTTMWTFDQWKEVGKPLIDRWASLHEGRFPPLDPLLRDMWQGMEMNPPSSRSFEHVMRTKAKATAWWEDNILPGATDGCSDSLLIYDIGPGGYPSYREEASNTGRYTSRLFTKPPNAIVHGALLCPVFGCADFTIPIGQAPYLSAVSQKEEMMPVTINIVAGRGCDLIILDMIDKMVDAGLLREVKNGRQAFD
ncbi:hypothetical protein AUP68_00419 [Ilyonectria robusta]